MVATHWIASAFVAGVAADEPVPPADPGRYVDPANVGPGLIGFIIFVFLGIAVFFLWRSMNKQLNKIDFEDPEGVRPVNAPFSEADRAKAPGAAADPIAGAGVPPKDPGTT